MRKEQANIEKKTKIRILYLFIAELKHFNVIFAARIAIWRLMKKRLTHGNHAHVGVSCASNYTPHPSIELNFCSYVYNVTKGLHSQTNLYPQLCKPENCANALQSFAYVSEQPHHCKLLLCRNFSIIAKSIHLSTLNRYWPTFLILLINYVAILFNCIVVHTNKKNQWVHCKTLYLVFNTLNN